MSEAHSSGAGQSTSLPADLALAGQRIDAELRRKSDRVMSFDRGAARALEEASTEYLADLGQEAIRLARKDRLRTVDREHIEQAEERLGMGSSQSHLGSASSTLGGLLAGAGLAAGYAVAFTAGEHSTPEIVTAIILNIFGFFFLAVGITLTMVRDRG